MMFSATDTYNLSLSDSAEGDEFLKQSQNEEEDEPTDPFV